MATKHWSRRSAERWRRGQLESLKLMSKSQAALLRAYAVDRIHERDALVETALAFVVSAAENPGEDQEAGARGGADDSGYDAKAVQELVEWRKRLGEETSDLDPGGAVDDRLSEELKHLRQEGRLQARKLDDMQHALEVTEDEADELKSKLRKSEAQYAKLRDLLRDVREELATRDKGGVVPKEDFERLWQKYDRAKAKIRALKEVAEPFLPEDTRDTPRLPRKASRDNSSGPEEGEEAAGDSVHAAVADDNRGPTQAAGETNNESPALAAPADGEGNEIRPAKGGAATPRQEGSAPENKVHATVGGTELPSSEIGGGTAVAASPTPAVDGDGEGGLKAEGAVDVEAMIEEQRLLRLELEDAKKRTEKAKRGRKAAEKEKEDLVRAMAKELGDLEQANDGQIRSANLKVERLMAAQARSRLAIRELANRAQGERAAIQRLAQGVKTHLRELPEVAGAAIGTVQSSLNELEGRVAEVRKQYTREYRERRRLFNVVQELRGNIRVLCRCRPRTVHDQGGKVCVSFPGEGAIEIVNERGKRKAWAFDQVFGLEARQESVYAEVSSIVVSVLDGYNACIFAYGQTGTGKTYTMMGPPADRGVNARALEDLFARSAARRGEVDDTITISILEIYNEHIRDLLIDNGGDQRKLEVRQGERGNHVPGLTTIAVSALDEVLRMLTIADKNRASACTNLNHHSSRSHLILSVNVEGVNRHSGAKSTGRLHLIDLAGSERISKSGAAGQALREAQNINRSLSALGDVISARASRQAHVPYRNSILTYLLQDSLSADSKTLMLVCVSPVVQSAEESWCSLNFAARVRTVELGKANKHGDNGLHAQAGGRLPRPPPAGAR